MLEKKKILNILKKYKIEHDADYGITKIGIFGSVARDESNESSDVDVVVELKKPNLFTLSSIKQDLEDKLENRVDVVRIRDKMNQFLKSKITKEAIYV
ncbi:nucleotidyltransferase family protein [Sulfurospirillum arcachonense]|uniref:nucleotidyltransferase family protein n=1 Tax=Sulfurospirillum arcachonense TaxID=57666 RepID=UPI000469FE9E|nr:nucleotidyltransferase domain-containing protein [Sulfurospirillum arcachonense]